MRLCGGITVCGAIRMISVGISFQSSSPIWSRNAAESLCGSIDTGEECRYSTFSPGENFSNMTVDKRTS